MKNVMVLAALCVSAACGADDIVEKRKIGVPRGVRLTAINSVVEENGSVAENVDLTMVYDGDRIASIASTGSSTPYLSFTYDAEHLIGIAGDVAETMVWDGDYPTSVGVDGDTYTLAYEDDRIVALQLDGQNIGVLAYDDEGRLVRIDGRARPRASTFAYDDDRQLAEASDYGTEWTFRYSAGRVMHAGCCGQSYDLTYVDNLLRTVVFQNGTSRRTLTYVFADGDMSEEFIPAPNLPLARMFRLDGTSRSRLSLEAFDVLAATFTF